MSHASVNMSKPRPHSLAYGIFNTFFGAKYNTILAMLLIFETFLGIGLVSLFFLNSLSMIGLNSTQIANDYRSCMLLIFVVLHIFAMFQMRQSQQGISTDPNKISIYIAIATIEMSMLNGYLWMFSSDHAWGIDTFPLIAIAANLWIRGTCILSAIAVRAHMIEQQRPSRARDASEIYEPDMTDADDDSPVIFDLATA
ncbi:unnamed protein product [Caenorhabditis angaria]|uniref:Uncharacterized protein n=1 Tax=Caenorhabditis angaria TaxID=860376 RepID=A0A9P1I9X3_9PELO|nr:unnamed protein product [Caenorhabditis angaria]